MSRSGPNAEMERRAAKARAIAVSADTAATEIAKQVVLASGIALTSLLALLLMRP